MRQIIKLLDFINVFHQELHQPRKISRNTLNFALFLVVFGVNQDFLVAGAQEKT